jgi:hypothetical protein
MVVPLLNKTLPLVSEGRLNLAFHVAADAMYASAKSVVKCSSDNCVTPPVTLIALPLPLVLLTVNASPAPPFVIEAATPLPLEWLMTKSFALNVCVPKLTFVVAPV